jgi:hypothetical protein
MKGEDEEVRGRGFVRSGGRMVLSFAVGLENRGWGVKEGYGRISFIKLIGGVLTYSKGHGFIICFRSSDIARKLTLE